MNDEKRWSVRPKGSNWGDFGPDDQIGRLNLITPDHRRRAAQDALGWEPAKPRPRKVSVALQAYAAMTTSAARGAVRDVTQLKRG